MSKRKALSKTTKKLDSFVLVGLEECSKCREYEIINYLQQSSL